MTQPSAPQPSAPRPRFETPARIGPVGSWLAPGLSVVGLLMVAVVTLNLMNGSVPFLGGSPGNGNPNGSGDGNGPTRTAAPSNIVVVPEVTFAGTMVYAKAGNIWVQSGKDAHQLTDTGQDSMPSWAPDGEFVYFIRTRDETGNWPADGQDRRYAMTVPAIARVKADGSAPAEVVLDGRIDRSGDRSWFSWIRQPVLSPDGQTLAIVSDLPDPTKSDVVLQLYDMATERSTIPKVSETLGHQDPAWRHDGKVLLYVRNGREGARGAPIIFRLDVAKGTSVAVTGPGYLEPAYSPDGRFIVATKTSAFGNDIVILDAVRGQELLRITNDGASWAPVWSPVGDSIAFLHIDGQIVDLRQVKLDGAAPGWTVGEIIDLTEVSGLDGASRPGWFVPADQLPAPTPTPTPIVSTAPSGSTAP